MPTVRSFYPPITLNSLAISARFYAYSVGYCLKNEYHQVYKLEAKPRESS